jgi:hypothetical protein
MQNCRESFSDIVSIWPFAAGEIKFQTPFNVRTRKVTVLNLGVNSLEELLKNRDYYSVGKNYEDANCVEIEERKCVLKSTTKYSSSGRSFDVQLVLIISEKSALSANLMDKIEADRHDFVVRCADGEHLLVRSVDMSYKCVVKEDFAENYQQEINITMENYNGIQRIY